VTLHLIRTTYIFTHTPYIPHTKHITYAYHTIHTLHATHTTHTYYTTHTNTPHTHTKTTHRHTHTHTHTNHMKERQSAFEQKARYLNGRGTGMANVEKCALYISHESRKDTVWAENRKKQGMGKENGKRTRA